MFSTLVLSVLTQSRQSELIGLEVDSTVSELSGEEETD